MLLHYFPRKHNISQAIVPRISIFLDHLLGLLEHYLRVLCKSELIRENDRTHQKEYSKRLQNWLAAAGLTHCSICAVHLTRSFDRARKTIHNRPLFPKHELRIVSQKANS